VGTALRGLTAALALATATSPAAAAEDVVEPLSVTGSVAVPAGGTKTLKLTCPTDSVAVGGAPTSEGAYDFLPTTGARAWIFRFAAAEGHGRTGGAILRCVRLRLPKDVDGVGLVVGTHWSQRLDIPAVTTSRFGLDCNRGQIPTGWGIERGAGGDARRLAIAAAIPTKRGYVFKLKNTGRADASALVHVRCLQKTQRATSHQRHSFRARVAGFRDTPEAVETHSCRPGEFSVSTGVSIDPAADLVLTGAYPTGERGGRWSFRGRTSGPPVTTKLVCLSTKTRFR
jgi:hypothetical protein